MNRIKITFIMSVIFLGVFLDAGPSRKTGKEVFDMLALYQPNKDVFEKLEARCPISGAVQASSLLYTNGCRQTIIEMPSKGGQVIFDYDYNNNREKYTFKPYANVKQSLSQDFLYLIFRYKSKK